MSFRDVPPQELVEALAIELKKIPQLKAPEWAAFAKTGSHTEKPPTREDWWHVRAASILRKIALLGPVGVAKLRVKFGGKKNRGYGKERFMQGAGNHIRKILQQLEKAGFAKQDKKNVHKGRVITPQGVSFLDAAAEPLMKKHNIILPKKPEKKLQEIMPKEAKKSRRKKEAQQKPEGVTSDANTEPKPKKPRVKKTKPKEEPAPALQQNTQEKVAS